MNHQEVERYLQRIGAPAGDLGALHYAHLLAVPFENLNIHAREPIELSTAWLFDKIVTRRRGGFCYELNGLFAELLAALGHKVERLAARVYKPDGTLGIPFDHLCLRVDDTVLADVGFGDCFIRPLSFDAEGEQHDGRATFRIDGGDLWMNGERQYRFERTPYALADFEPGSRHHQSSPDSPFTKKRVCSRLTENGRVTLRDDRLIERTAGQTIETPIGPTEWTRLLEERFGIR